MKFYVQNYPEVIVHGMLQNALVILDVKFQN